MLKSFSLRLFFFSLVFLLTSAPVFSQLAVKSAECANNDCSEIEVILTDTIDSAAHITRALILDHSTGTTYPVTGYTFIEGSDLTNHLDGTNPSKYFETSALRLQKPGGIQLIVDGTKPECAALPNPKPDVCTVVRNVMLLLYYQPVTGGPVTTLTSGLVKRALPSISPQFVPAKAEGRDDAAWFITGDLNTSVGSKPQYSTDIKMEFENGLTPKVRFKPFFSLKASNKEDADPDSMRFGLNFINSFKFADEGSDDELLKRYGIVNSMKDTIEKLEKHQPLTINPGFRTAGDMKIANTQANPLTIDDLALLRTKRPERNFYRWEGGIAAESDKNWKVANILSTFEVRYLAEPWKSKHDHFKLSLTPFVGTELGRNIKSPVIRVEKTIARFYFGATALAHITTPAFLPQGLFQHIDWETKFTHRMFAKDEQFYNEDEKGNLALQTVGRVPQSFISSKFTFKLNDYIGPTLKYEWGKEPPLYKKVDHKVTFGFTWLFKDKNAN